MLGLAEFKIKNYHVGTKNVKRHKVILYSKLCTEKVVIFTRLPLT
jgi:hypothetical protein